MRSTLVASGKEIELEPLSFDLVVSSWSLFARPTPCPRRAQRASASGCAGLGWDEGVDRSVAASG